MFYVLKLNFCNLKVNFLHFRACFHVYDFVNFENLE
jgi:hypothetical protein